MTVSAPAGDEACAWFSPVDLADPYQTCAALRREAPVFRDGHHDLGAVSRYLDVLPAVKDPETFSSGGTLTAVGEHPPAVAEVLRRGVGQAQVDRRAKDHRQDDRHCLDRPVRAPCPAGRARRDSALLGPAVEEVLRSESSAQSLFRVTTRPVTLDLGRH